MSDKGVSVNYLPSLPFYLNLGAEIFQGENEILFGKEAKMVPTLTPSTQRHLLTLEAIHHSYGISILKGNTYTQIGEDSYFDGKSSLYDFEFTYKWKKSNIRALLSRVNIFAENRKAR
jgi:hypothetical protein